MALLDSFHSQMPSIRDPEIRMTLEQKKPPRPSNSGGLNRERQHDNILDMDAALARVSGDWRLDQTPSFTLPRSDMVTTSNENGYLAEWSKISSIFFHWSLYLSRTVLNPSLRSSSM